MKLRKIKERALTRILMPLTLVFYCQGSSSFSVTLKPGPQTARFRGLSDAETEAEVLKALEEVLKAFQEGINKENETIWAS